MMTNLVARAWQNVKPHVPLIKFRKGSVASPAPQTVHVVPGVSHVQASQSGPKPNYKPVQTSPTLHDWQLPNRYRRQPLSQQEIDFINRGGPE